MITSDGNYTDIEIQYVLHKNMGDNIRLFEKNGIYYLGLRAVEKPIYKSEYEEILKMVNTQDNFDKNIILLSENYDWFWNKFFNFRDSDKLQKIGVNLFGPSWKKAIAEALKVDQRRITHWLQCTRPIDNDVWDNLKAIVEQRQRDVQDAFDILTLPIDELTKKAVKKALI